MLPPSVLLPAASPFGSSLGATSQAPCPLRLPRGSCQPDGGRQARFGAWSHSAAAGDSREARGGPSGAGSRAKEQLVLCGAPASFARAKQAPGNEGAARQSPRGARLSRPSGAGMGGNRCSHSGLGSSAPQQGRGAGQTA